MKNPNLYNRWDSEYWKSTVPYSIRQKDNKTNVLGMINNNFGEMLKTTL